MRLIPTPQNRRTVATLFGFRRLSVGALTAVALFTPPAFALSVFDAIQLSKQGYSDQSIIDLIEATDSAFTLEAEDLPKLKQLGVSEPVIRAMLERAVTAQNAGNAHRDRDGDVSKHGDTPHASNSQRDNPFTTQPLHEARGGDHVHQSLALDGLNVLTLRDEGGHASIESRGQALVERLGEVWAAAMRGHFRAERAASGALVVFRRETAETGALNPHSIEVLTVSAGDARGYELRSGHGVTPDLLARYWADLLSDFWAVAHGEPPEQLLALHEGEALALLRESVTRLDESNRTLRAAAEAVPSATRHHLERLARTVPVEYSDTGGH